MPRRDLVEYVVDMGGDVAAEGNKAKRALKGLEDQAEETGRAVEGAGKIGKAFGGKIGGAVTVVEDFTSGLGEMTGTIGVAGTAIAGGTLALAGFAFVAQAAVGALISISRSAADAAEKYKDFLDPDLKQRSDDFTESIDAMDRSLGLLLTDLATRTQPLEDFLDIVTGFADMFRESLDEMQKFGRGVVQFANIVRPHLPLFLQVGLGTALGAQAVGSAATGSALERGRSIASAGDFIGPTLEQAGLTNGREDGPIVVQIKELIEVMRPAAKVLIDGVEFKNQEFSAAIVKFEEFVEAEAAAERLARQTAVAGEIGSTIGALSGGEIPALIGTAVAGPVGALVAELLTSEQGIPQQALDLQQDVIDLLESLPEILAGLLSADFLSDLLAGAAEVFTKTFITLLPELAIVFFESLDSIFTELPGLLADAFTEAVRDLIEFFSDIPGRIADAFTGPEGNVLGIDLRNNGDGFHLPIIGSFAEGTNQVRSTGLALLHENEMVVPAEPAARMRQFGMQGVSIGQLVLSPPDTRSLTNDLQRHLGLYGLNLSDSPLVS